MNSAITGEMLTKFITYLLEEEKCEATIEKYVRDTTQFAQWLGDRLLSKETVVLWKKRLIDDGSAAATVNGKLCSLSAFLKFIGRADCRVKLLRIQRRAFRDDSRDLTKKDYERLVHTAETRGNYRIALIMETICSTGIRVSETKYITVEGAKRGIIEIRLKGKLRTILLPKKLCRKLLKYVHEVGITRGCVFITSSGKQISRRQIWGEMKAVCEAAGVDSRKVFPHNLRHLFAVEYYRVSRDIVKLADVLGHSSIETTRIYLITTGLEHQKQIDSLRLVS